MSDDASATYRGFRNQALYALHRILTDPPEEKRIYRPEGTEDLAVYNSRQKLVEAIQVKDYSSKLSLSSLRTFLGRIYSERTERPFSLYKLVSYGELGTELSGALAGNTADELEHQNKVLIKMENWGKPIPQNVGKIILENLQSNVSHPVQSALVEKITEIVSATNASSETQVTIELLMFWIFEASENRTTLTRRGLLSQLDRISTYLTSLRDHRTEWNVSIRAINHTEIDEESETRLRREYRSGVQADWEHIQIGVDCPRPERLKEIRLKFKEEHVVILRGASGQGKSSLAWRYLHDYCVEGLRFHVRLVEGRAHAIRIANALGSHVRRLRLDAVVFIDVSPSDSGCGWVELVKELVGVGMKVLIAVRQEDFQRANISRSEFTYSEVVLDRIKKEEAEPIYTALNKSSENNTLDFEEAWANFDMFSGGPLLEFTHLVSEGQTLDSCVKAQINRISEAITHQENGLTENHRDLLALAAIANETGAKISLPRLLEEVNLTPLSQSLRLFEDEYLIRVNKDGEETTLVGLHALRSKAIVKAILHEQPDYWLILARRVLPLLMEDDLENFLLSAFARETSNCEAMFADIQGLTLRSWRQSGGIMRALIWEGLSRYEIQNRSALSGLIETYRSGWWIACDSFTGMEETECQNLLRSISELRNGLNSGIELTPKVRIFDLFSEWARTSSPPPPPEHGLDWISAGDIAFWIGKKNIEGPLRNSLQEILPDSFPNELNIEEIAQFISGRAMLGDSDFAQWHESLLNHLLELLVRESELIWISDNSSEIKAFFTVAMVNSETNSEESSNDWHAQALQRIKLLRQIFPERAIYSSAGIGLLCLSEILPYDPTAKNIPVANLPHERSVHINAIFQNLVSYRQLRPDSWTAYSNRIIEFRELTSKALLALTRFWEKLIKESPVRQATLKKVPQNEIVQAIEILHLPLFPKNVVDQWGFLSENTNPSQRANTMQTHAMSRFEEWKLAASDYQTSVSNILNQSAGFIQNYLVQQQIGQELSDAQNNQNRVMLVNLGDAGCRLTTFQQHFRKWFKTTQSSSTLNGLERTEQRAVNKLWTLSYSAAAHPLRHSKNPSRLIEVSIANRKERLIQDITTNLAEVLNEHASFELLTEPIHAEGKTHFLITCDYPDINSCGEFSEEVLRAIWQAVHVKTWVMFEWKPLQLTWENFTVVNLVKGKALYPAWNTNPSIIFFQSDSEIEFLAHHLTALPVDEKTFKSTGLNYWDEPIIQTTLKLVSWVTAFGMTLSRYAELEEMIVANEIDDAHLERISNNFASDLTPVRETGLHYHESLRNILLATDFSESGGWIESLDQICGSLLLDLDEEAHIVITLKILNHWFDNFEDLSRDLLLLTTEIVNRSICS